MITHVEIKNYKSIGDVSLDLGPLTVLVGENGSGKSNLVDALRFVSDALSVGLDVAVRLRGGINGVLRCVPTSEDTAVLALRVATDEVRGHYGFELHRAGSGGFEAREESGFAEGEGGRTPSIDMSVVSGQPWLSLPHSSDPRLGRLLAEMRNTRCYSLFPDDLRHVQELGPEHPLSEDGENLASVLEWMDEHHGEWLSEVRDALARMVPGIHGLRVEKAGQTHRLIEVGHVEDGAEAQWFDLARESDGTVRLLALLAALYQQPSPSLIAIEEPELYVHPGAMGVLCDEIRAASHRTQVLITTHSPDILDRFKPEEIRVVEKHVGVTEIGPVAEYQVGAIRDRLMAPGQLMQAEGLRMQRGGS